MLTAAFIYAIKSALVLSILYLVYHWVFRKNTHYHLKRVALLAILIASVALPAIEVKTVIDAAPAAPIVNHIDSVMGVTQTSNSSQETIVQELSTMPVEAVSFTWSEAILYLYWIGVSVSLLIFFYQLASVVYLIAAGDTRHDLGRKLVSHKKIKYPFSFWKWTFIPANFNMSHKNWVIIHDHELAHLRQAHSVDLMLASLTRCFLWFTPAAFYLQKSIRDNHEFLADQEVLKNHTMVEYSEVLLSVCLQADSLQLTHSFALKSNLSKRIKHMNLQQTSKVRSFLSISTMIFSIMLLATQVSLYGQGNEQLAKKDKVLKVLSQDNARTVFSSQEVYNKTGQEPDGWAHFMRQGAVPIILLDGHKVIMATFKESSENEKNQVEGERYFRVSLRNGKSPEFGDFEFTTLQENKLSTELIQQLTTQEKIEMYTLSKAWAEQYILPVYPDYQMISELHFLEKHFLVFHSQPSLNNPAKYNIRTVFKSKEVDRLPEPIGGLERYILNVAKYSRMDPSLIKSDLPSKIIFEFTIDRGGNMVLLSLKSKVRGSKDTQKKVYALLRQVNDNLIKVSSVYGWKPGQKEGSTVATQMRVEIPKELL